MKAPDPTTIADAVAALANALQIAIPVAARIRERTEALTEDAERLDLAITRAGDALRRLQPRSGA
jgi:hypothetical protein